MADGYFQFCLAEMPDEILLEIFLFLAHPRSLGTFVRLRGVCRKFYYLAEDEILWWQLQESCVTVDPEFFAPIAIANKLEQRKIFDWYSRKRPLCDGCGQSASSVFRNFASFVLSDGPFVCPPCRKLRANASAGMKLGEQEQRIEQLPAKAPLGFRSSSAMTSTTKVLQESLAVLNKRAEILDDLAKRGIKVKTGKELQEYLNGRSQMTRDQLIVLLQQRQDESDAEARRREDSLKKKRDGLLLRDFKPLDLSILEMTLTPRSSKLAALARLPEAPASTHDLGLSTSRPAPTFASSSPLQKPVVSKRLFANHKPLPSVLPPITSLVRPSTGASPRPFSRATLP